MAQFDPSSFGATPVTMPAFNASQFGATPVSQTPAQPVMNPDGTINIPGANGGTQAGAQTTQPAQPVMNADGTINIPSSMTATPPAPKSPAPNPLNLWSLAGDIVTPFVNNSLKIIRTGAGAIGGALGLTTAGVGALMKNKSVENAGLNFAANETNPNTGVFGQPDSSGATTPITNTQGAIGAGATVGSYVAGAGDAGAAMAEHEAPSLLSSIWNAFKGGSAIGAGQGLGMAANYSSQTNQGALASTALDTGGVVAGGVAGGILGAATDVGINATGEALSFTSDLIKGIAKDGQSFGEAFGSAFDNVKTDLYNSYVKQTTTDWSNQEKGTIGTQKQAARSAARGKSPQSLLSTLGITPSSLVEDGRFALQKITDAAGTIGESIAPLESAFGDMLKASDQVTPPTSLDELRTQAVSAAQALKNTKPSVIESMVSSINDEFDSIVSKYGDSIGNFEKNEQKKAFAMAATYDPLKPFMGDVNKIIAGTFRTSIQDTVDNVEVGELNKVVGNYYDAIDYMKSFAGKKMATSFGSKVMSAAIKTAGTAIGESLGGPVTGVVGFMTSRAISSAMDGMSNPLRDYIFASMTQDSPDILNSMLEYLDNLGKENVGRLQLPAPSAIYGQPSAASGININPPMNPAQSGLTMFDPSTPQTVTPPAQLQLPAGSGTQYPSEGQINLPSKNPSALGDQAPNSSVSSPGNPPMLPPRWIRDPKTGRIMRNPIWFPNG